VRRNRAQKIKNPAYPPTDPRRWEPGTLSIKRAAGASWWKRWTEKLSLPAFGLTDEGYKALQERERGIREAA
jgi:hypothetical protein